VRRYDGTDNTYLEITLFQNQFQLGTNDALYSDGDRYTPAVTAVKNLRGFLPSMRSVLVLGAGLCSMVHVMRRKNTDPYFTLVEKDKVVLEWAMELLDPLKPEKTQPVCADAEAFMQTNAAKYDFVFLDIFKGRVVPSFVCTGSFLEQCRVSLAPGGHLAFNYIVNDAEEWEQVKNTFTTIFPQNKIIASSVNRILIGSC
jgi:spermidine synthase